MRGTESGAERRSRIEIRPARPSDAADLADLYWRARQTSVPAIPPPVHPRESITEWMRETVLVERRTWVPIDAHQIVGILVIEDPDWIDQLYVEPDLLGRGIGTLLLRQALQHTRGPARLWCFQSNAPARRFYERHGFVATAWTEGDNEEGAPDVLYIRS
ncbi:MAG: N-acetyltransferase family protein [Dermatophilaceae bacterium]|nr:GNAT family N-acetyltransferase [Intrasporangiaceae bacterium]